MNPLLWNSLRKIAENPASKATIATPFLGHIVIYSDKLQPFLKTIFDETPSLRPVDVPPNLALTYVGLSMFGFGSLLFQLCCPLIVKKFADAESAVAGLKSDATESYLRFEYDNCRKADPNFMQEIRSYTPNKPTARQSEGLDVPELSPIKNDILFQIYQSRNRSAIFGRLFSSALLWIGLLIAAFPAVLILIRLLITMSSKIL